MKKSTLFSLILIGLCLSIFWGCKSKNNNVDRAFYYWKSTFELSAMELKILHQNKINKLYVKFFDVSWNSKLNTTTPLAKIKFKEAIPRFLELVPVVYITNNAMLKSSKNDIKNLASAVSKLILAYQPHVNKTVHEVQLDCDWTLQSKENYFTFINELKKQLGKEIILSATIRLHQIKYAATTGIPPVEKGMLMYYNMGNMQSATSNSIFNKNDAEKYAAYIKQYPLHLDAVLPVFSWIKVFRNQKLMQLINTVSIQQLLQTNLFIKLNENTLRPNSVCHFNGFSFLPNDILIAETLTPKLSKNAAEHLNNYFKEHDFTLALFHLNQSNLNEYTFQDIENIYAVFN